MKLTDIQTEKSIQEAVLVEKLGTLAQLGVGPLIDVLKQQTYAHKSYQGSIGATGKKFQDTSYSGRIGATSEIIDIGPVKKGLTDIRKAYKTIQAEKGISVTAFAVYIGGAPVAFAVFDSDALAGSSRTGKLAYDLSAFKSAVEQIDASKPPRPSAWRQPEPSTALQTAQDREEKDWDYRAQTYVTSTKKYTGKLETTAGLKDFFELLSKISAIVGKPITAKVVLSDRAGFERHKKRYNAREIATGAKDLKTRLAIYKNQKNPTVETIEDFIAMSLKNPGKKARFAGQTYHLKTTSYDKIEPQLLLSGKPFTVRYASAEPGVYDSLELTYAYDPANNQLKPVFAVWYDRTDPANYKSRQEAALDHAGYAKLKLGIKNLEDKDAVIKKLLELFKENAYYTVLLLIDSLDKIGINWPELSAIKKSANIEYTKQREQKKA